LSWRPINWRAALLRGLSSIGAPIRMDSPVSIGSIGTRMGPSADGSAERELWGRELPSPGRETAETRSTYGGPGRKDDVAVLHEVDGERGRGLRTRLDSLAGDRLDAHGKRCAGRSEPCSCCEAACRSLPLLRRARIRQCQVAKWPTALGYQSSDFCRAPRY